VANGDDEIECGILAGAVESSVSQYSLGQRQLSPTTKARVPPSVILGIVPERFERVICSATVRDNDLSGFAREDVTTVVEGMKNVITPILRSSSIAMRRFSGHTMESRCSTPRARRSRL
jgi:hypothetical protein